MTKTPPHFVIPLERRASIDFSCSARPGLRASSIHPNATKRLLSIILIATLKETIGWREYLAYELSRRCLLVVIVKEVFSWIFFLEKEASRYWSETGRAAIETGHANVLLLFTSAST